MGKMFQRRDREKFPAFQARCAATLETLGRVWPKQKIIAVRPTTMEIVTEIPKAEKVAKKRVRKPAGIIAETPAEKPKPKRVRKPKTTEVLTAIAV